MIGQTISHYRIIEKIGEGGMSVVYRAEDTKLKRTVALKFLPPHALGSDEEKARFLREAQSAASLEHPNICTIYEVNEFEDKTFIVMPYLEGSDLRNKIDEGPFKIETALEMTIQIAEGLQAAHEKGIVHRDIKSANIMFTRRGQPKIMDFGLAKSAEAVQVTQEGTTVGTVAYMSPEQTTSEVVDQRSDIWSFGVVMYEMLTGQRPFRGDYEQAVIYSIVNEDPEPITALRTGVPVEFERIIFKTLAKNPKHRYQSIEDVLVDLRRMKAEMDSKELLSRTGVRLPSRRRRRSTWLIPLVMVLIVTLAAVYFLEFQHPEAEGAPIPIAVADFLNETNEGELNGLSGMLITSLEQSRRLSVLTRTRMFDILKQMGRDDISRIDEALGREICQEANINVLVVASIRSFDELYTIDLKAFDIKQNKHLFATKEEGSGKSSIPSMIDKLAQKTRRELNEKSDEIQLTSENVADVITPNLEAYQQYFLGEQYINQLEHEKAQAAFHKAIELDSTFALAYYRLAYASWWGSENEDVQRAQLDKALQLIDRLPEKYRYLLQAQNKVLEEGLPEGIKVLKEMERIYPKDKEMIYNIGDFSYHEGLNEQAVDYLEKVFKMDPSHQRTLDHLTMTYMQMGEYEKALEMGRRYLVKDKSARMYLFISKIQLKLHDVEGALQTLAKARAEYPDVPGLLAQEINVYIYLDEYDRAMQIFSAFPADSLQEKSQWQLLEKEGLIQLYKGQYRDALTRQAEKIQFIFEKQDSALAAFQYATNAFIYVTGWENSEKASEAMASALQFQDAIRNKYSQGMMKQLYEEYWANIATLHVLMGELDRANAIVTDVLKDKLAAGQLIRFLIHAQKNELNQARVLSDSLLQSGRSWHKQMGQYYMAVLLTDNGDYDEAIAHLEEVQASVDVENARPVLYPMSLHLMGTIFEKSGDTLAAAASYEKLLNLWRDADPDLRILVDAKSRLAGLKSSATQ